MILGANKIPAMKFFSESGFSIKVLWVGIAAGVNGPVIFLSKVLLVHPSIRGTNLGIQYIFTELSCVIPNKLSYMNEENWEKVVKFVAPYI